MRILVTRPEAQAAALAARLRELGHDVVERPLIAIEPLPPDPIDVGGYDWIVVTSANGAEQLLRRARGPLPRVAAIGRATAEALARRGVRAALVARTSTQEGLLAEFPHPAGRVLVAAAEGARRLLVEELAADFVPLYRTRPLDLRPPLDADLVVLASPSAARALARVERAIPAVSIGPQTTEAARAAGLEVVAEATTHDVSGLVAAVARAAR